jgi:hypothetical protein
VGNRAVAVLSLGFGIDLRLKEVSKDEITRWLGRIEVFFVLVNIFSRRGKGKITNRFWRGFRQLYSCREKAKRNYFT